VLSHSSEAARRARSAGRGAAGEAGETLVELMVTIVLLGTAVLAILTSLLALTNISDLNNQATRRNVLLQAYAEQLRRPVATMVYKPCADLTTNAYPALSISTTYTAQITGIKYLTGFSAGSPSSPQWSALNVKPASCSGATPTDGGLQQIWIAVDSGTGARAQTDTVIIVKRDASCATYPGYANTDQGPC
jgi:type II secretory pathway pseudopilin PulG